MECVIKKGNTLPKALDLLSLDTLPTFVLEEANKKRFLPEALARP